MANWSMLKQAIANVIKTNGNQEITGQKLQNILISIVNSVGENYTFAGVADTSTEPGSPDGHVFYLATKSGEYSNFGGIIIDKEVAIIRNTADGGWEKIKTGIASVESLIEGGEIVVKVDVDSELSDASTNPVQNKVITAELGKKQDLLVDGTNIKTINRQSILGAGNINIEEKGIEPATEIILGGINASPKTEEETVEAKIGEDNKLYVPASTSAKNLADEEDLTSKVEDSKSVMKFADKAYDASSFSGQGRVYLRKNIVLGKNILTQSMINDANTRYIIQYDYDLNGETISIPEGCTLDFQGGRFNDGAVVFSNTLLCGNVKIDCNFNGQVENNEVYISWFGDRTDDIYYNKILEQTYSILKSGVLKLDGKKYDVNAIELKSNVSIDLCGSEVRQISGSNNTPIFSASNCTNIEIFNGIINGNKDSVSGNNSNGIRFISCKNFYIKNIAFKNVRRGCIICWSGCEMFSINNVSASDCGLPDSISTLMESYDCHYFNLSLIKFINSYGVGIYTHSCTDFNINTATLSDIGIDNGLTTEDCYRFAINNVITERNSNIGIEINSSANFKVTNCESRYNAHHNVFISTFKAYGYSQSYLGVIENLITEGAESEYNGLKITSGTNIDVCNCQIKDNIFLTKLDYSSELITLRNVKSPLLCAVNTDNLVLINCIIDSITGNSNPARFPLDSNDKSISRYIGGTLKTNEYIEIELPGDGNVTSASGTIDILTIFPESFSQNCKALISFKVIANTLTKEIISKIPGSVTRELTLSNDGNKLIIRNDTNVSLIYRISLNAVYL